METRPAAFAGTFYPDAPDRLRDAVLAFLDEGASLLKGAMEAPKAIIAPHAGYMYSGSIAGTAFSLLRGENIERIVLVGPSHRVFLEGVALPAAQRLATPLGDVRVDGAAAKTLVDHGEATINAKAHAQEHSLEVELPFLQVVAPAAQIVPLVVGDASPQVVAAAIERLWGGPETRFVISSDLSHYLPMETAHRVDASTASKIQLLEHVDPDEACGARGIDGLLEVAKRRRMRAVSLDLRTSGDTVPASRRAQRGEVVGYGAFAFYERPSQVNEAVS